MIDELLLVTRLHEYRTCFEVNLRSSSGKTQKIPQSVSFEK